MSRRIAVVDNKKLRDQQQKEHLMRICPVNKGGSECIYMDGERLGIDENLCIGCGICVKAAPEAISIINLPEALDKPPVHRYGRNGFHLYNLPTPTFGKVTGIVGRNGIGKSTAIQILSGLLRPNLGKDTDEHTHEASWQELIDRFKGTETQSYFEKLRDDTLTVAVKPQLVDKIPEQFNGTVRQLLKSTASDTGRIDTIVQRLGLTKVMERNIDHVSGGELQRIAIAATVLKDAQVYIFDEPTSYLDIKQRLEVARFLRELVDENTAVLVIEHDLIILDAMSDMIHVMYGQQNAYGVVSMPTSTKAGINLYLDGYLPSENVRFRNYTLDFHTAVEKSTAEYPIALEWSDISLNLGSFTIDAGDGAVHKHETVGVLGENGIGKTTFVKLLAGVMDPDTGTTSESVKVSYKPQYLTIEEDRFVAEVLHEAMERYKMQIIRPLELEALMDRQLSQLSGGELQRVAIAQALAKDADLYLLDEPSAYLDVEQRLAVSKVIMDHMQIKGTTALVVDHDLLFVDYLSRRLMVFTGEPAVRGHAEGPFSLQEGMNHFLEGIGLTFRRDEQSFRPRANKPGSQIDAKQRKEGKWYHI